MLMRRTVAASTLLLGLTATAAFGACGDDLAALREDAPLSARIAAAPSEKRRLLRNLAEAARELDAEGLDEPCAAVIAAMRMIAAPDASGLQTARSAPLGERSDAPSAAQGEGAANTRTATDETASSTEDSADAPPLRDYAAGAERSRPVRPGSLHIGDSLLGADVRLMDGSDAGAVDGFLLDGTGLTHLIVGYGGFLGLGDREIAAPIERVRYDPDTGALYVDASKDWFDAQADWDQRGLSDRPDFWIKDVD
jgi:hypothetical protein